MKTHYSIRLLLVLFAFFAISEANAQNVSVVSSGGPSTSATYATLKAAFDKIDSGMHAGVISITISGNVVETAPAVLVASGTSYGSFTASYTKVSISPVGGPWTISGAGSAFNSNGLIILDGADNVIIDGGSSRNLIINNASAVIPAAVWLKSGGAIGLGCSNDTIINCQMKTGIMNTESYGIILSGYNTTSPIPTSSLAAYDCDNILIQNNKISNCYYGISATGNNSALSDNFIISKNEIGSYSSSASIGKYGVYISNMDSATISYNKVFNVINSADAYGVFLTNTKSAKIKNNNISNIYSTIAASSAPYGAVGIYLYNSINTSSIHTKIENNSIANVKYIGSESKNVDGYGIYANKVPYLDVINNSISGVSGSGYGSSSISAIGSTFGIFIDDALSQNVNINYNSINLYGAFPVKVAVATYVNMSAAIGLNNSSITANIYNNAFTNSLSAAASSLGTTNSFALYAAGGSLFNGTTNNINNNDYFVSGTNPNIALIGSTSFATLASWKANSTGDVNSISTNPIFNNNDNLIPLQASPLIGAGLVISGVSADMNGLSRSTTSPTIGSYEGGRDADAPRFSYTAIASSAVETNKMLNVAISDNFSGVDLSSANLPRIYYKKTSANNDSSSWKYSLANSASANTTFTIDYSKLGGVVIGDTVQYFIVAQDLASNVNLGISSGVLANAPTNVNLLTNAFPITGSVDSYAIINGISGTKTVGVGGDFTSLTGVGGAFETINSKTVLSDITLKIVSDINESGVVALRTITSLTGNEKINIVPNDAVLRTISGAKDSVGLIRFIGSKNINIDGSYNGVGKYLKIINTPVLNIAYRSATIQIASKGLGLGCQNINIKNSYVVGPVNNNSGTYAIYAGDTLLNSTAVNADNDAITISGNNIFRGYSLVYSYGTSAQINNNWTVSNNIFANSQNSLENNTTYCVYANYNDDASIIGNTIANINTSNSIFSIWYNYSQRIKITNNSLSNFASTGGNIYGIYGTYSQYPQIIGNKLNGFNNFSTNSIYGIFLSYLQNSKVNGNNIANLNCYGATGGQTSGIQVSANPNGVYLGDSLTFINNSISNLNAVCYSVYAVNISRGTNMKIMHNTVNLTGTRTAASSYNSYSFYIYGSGSIDSMANNSFSNYSVNTGGASSYGIYLSSLTVKYSNNNNFYAIGGALSYMASYNGTIKNTITDWRLCYNTDANSMNVDPALSSSSYLMPTATSPLLTAGTHTSVSSDILGVSRNSSVPSIGAYEKSFDAIAPLITYEKLGNTASLSNRKITVSITDNSGNIDTLANAPRLYYKKSTSSADSTAWFFVNPTSVAYPNYSFTIDYSKFSSISSGDNIQYFIVAQDLATSPNVAISDNLLANSPATSVKLLSTNFSIEGVISSYSISSGLSGVKTVGVGGAFTSLTANDSTGVFYALSKYPVTGDLTFKVISDLSESGAKSLTPISRDGGAWTIKLVPDGATERIISGAVSNNALLNIENVSGFIIDGSYNNAGRYLRFANTTATTTKSATIKISGNGFVGSRSKNITIKNCNIVGANITSTVAYGIYLGACDLPTNTLGDGSDSISIIGNSISKCYNGIYAVGNNLAYRNSNLLIQGNTIGTNDATSYVSFYGIFIKGAPNGIISGNEILNQKIATIGSAGIFVSDYCDSLLIEKNIIHGQTYTGSSVCDASGVYLSSSINSNSIKIINNVIFDISGIVGYSSATNVNSPAGIRIANGKYHKIYNNSINIFGAIPAGSYTTLGYSFDLYVANASATAVDSIDVRNNIFANTATTSVAGGSFCIAFYTVPTWANNKIDFNLYYSAPSITTLKSVGMAGNGTKKVLLSDWTASTGYDANSVETAPAFNSNMILALIGSLNTGAQLSDVTTDILGATRSNPPTIGAYENALDLIPPTLVYKALANTAKFDSKILAVTITDAVAGVDTINAPNLYYKKKTQANDSSSWKIAPRSGYWPDYIFTLDTAKIGSLQIGDEIQYFIIAKDIATNPNYIMSSGSISGSYTNTLLCSSNFPINGATQSFRVLPVISGVKTLGVNGNFASLTGDSLGLFKTLNNSVISGDLTIKVISNVTESGANTLNPRLDESGSWKVSIIPDTSIVRTLTGAYSGGLFRLRAFQNLTIDGSYNSNGRYLKFENSSTASATKATFQLISNGVGAGCKNIALSNSIILGPTNTGSSYYCSAIFAGDSTFSASSFGNNDSIIINNNSIYRGYALIYAYGASSSNSTYNQNWTISNNIFGSDNADNINYGIYSYYSENQKILNNTFKNFSATTTIAICCYYSDSLLIQQNKINNFIASNSPSYVFNINSSTNPTIAYNKISNILSNYAYGELYGMNISYSYKTKIIGNNVNSLKSSYIGYGIVLGFSPFYAGYSGDSSVFNNNSISAISAPYVSGVRYTMGKHGNFINNSIHLSGPISTTTEYQALYFTGASGKPVIIDSFYNNSISNNCINDKTTKGYAIRTDNNKYVTITNCDFNSYYANGNAYNYLAYWGAAINDSTLWQNTIVNDAAANFKAPLYTSDTLLLPLENSPLLNKGTPISSVTTDIIGATRDPISPAIGAYDKSWDIAPPSITVDKLSPSDNLTGRSVKAIITDAKSGVDTLNGPNLYFKKSSANNIQANWAKAVRSGSASNFDFAIDYSKIGGVNFGDTVQYFAVAQDLAPSINYAISSGAIAGNFTSSNLTYDNFPISGTIASYPIIEGFADSVITVGKGGSYLTLTGDSLGVFKKLNNNIITKNLTIKVVSDITESGVNSLNNLYKLNNVPYEVKIVPDSSILRTISGTYNGGLIRIQGVNGFTIDGSYNNAGSYLKFINSPTDTSVAASTIKLISLGAGVSCKNVNIKNSTIIGPFRNSKGMTSAIFAGGLTFDDGGNGYNDSVNIIKNAIYRGSSLIYSNPSGSQVNNGWNIQGNILGASSVAAENNTPVGIFMGNNTNILVQENAISGLYSANSEVRAISLSSTNNASLISNYINNITASAGSLSGVYCENSSNALIKGNTISHLSETSTTQYHVLNGINLESVVNPLVCGNNITNNNSTNNNYGIYLYVSTKGEINGNTINNLNSVTGSTFGFYKYSYSGENILIANNSISNLTAANEINGIYDWFGIGEKYINNSISLSGNRNSGYSTYAISLVGNSGANVLIDSLYNNTFTNTIHNSNVNAKNYGLLISSSVYVYNGGGNNIWVDDSNIVNNYVISYVGTDYKDLATYLSAFSVMSLFSPISNNPLFADSVNLIPSQTSPLLQSGILTSITTDIIGAQRPVLGAMNPSIGCYESLTDFKAPVITFDSLRNSTALNVRTFTAQITDAMSSVDTRLGKAPRLYFKKSSQPNDSAFWHYSVASGVAPNFTFTFDYSTIGGVNYGDGIDYFVIASDNYSNPNFGINSGTSISKLTSVNLAKANFPVIDYKSFKIFESINGVKTVGVGGDFLSLTGDSLGAFKTLASRIVVGDLSLKVISNLTESSTNALSTISRENGNWNVSLSPTNSTVRTISGANSSDALIRIEGVSGFTIDGSYLGSGKYLKFVNTASAPTKTATIKISDAGNGFTSHNVNVLNSTILGASNTVASSYGVYIGSKSMSASAFTLYQDSINVSNNSIGKASQGVLAIGASALSVKNNSIGSSNASEYIGSIGANIFFAPSALVSGNEIFNVSSGTTSTAIGLQILKSCDSSVIEKNNIHDISSNSSVYSAYGINIESDSTNSIGLIISNNAVYHLYEYGSTSADTKHLAGIRINGGVGHKIYYNSINLNGYFVSTDTNCLSSALMVCSASNSKITLMDNAFSNFMKSTSGATSSKSYAMYYPSGYEFGELNYNCYYSANSNSLIYFGVNVANVRDWLNIYTIQDRNSKSADPQFYAATLVPSSSSPLLYSGVIIAAVNDDITGTARRVLPSIGAYEEEFTNSLPSVETDTLVANRTQYSANTSGRILSQGGSTIQAKGMVLDIASYPTLSNKLASLENGSGLGAITATWTNLDAQRTYYVRAYATNLSGTSYGSNVSFTTLPNYYVPAVSSANATSVTSSSAILNGTVTSDYNSAIAERGFVWDTVNSVSTTSYIGKGVVPAIGGSYINAYAYSLTGLASNKTYYFSAYAINGIGTTKGAVISFTTLVDGYTVSGAVSYAQYAEDPTNSKILLTKSTFKAMPKAPWVKLLNASGALVDSTTADAATGAFSFTKVVNGAYRLVLDTNMTWTSTKGYQLTLVDYKYIKEYVVSLVYLDSLQMRAANIDRSGSGVNKASITLSDAANLMQRIVGLANANTWKSSNYMYAIETVPSSAANHTAAVMNLDMTVVVSGANKTGIIVRGLSSGDVNGQ